MTSEPANNPKPQPKRSFQAPKGTRDFYPQEMLRRRYITDAWRRVSLRHGFDEIDGPTFEHAELYTVKSGEGILSELFSFKREGGDDLYALRPEFTPTLARMYAARARQLPQPTKWFCIPSFFRAERPQRGRLREFFQWNVDVIGGEDPPEADAEVVECAIGACSDLGLTPQGVQSHESSRESLSNLLTDVFEVRETDVSTAIRHIDKWDRRETTGFRGQLGQLGVATESMPALEQLLGLARKATLDWEAYRSLILNPLQRFQSPDLRFFNGIQNLWRGAHERGLSEWVTLDLGIARGLAYYTGMVFEVIAEGERAVAGGGRYDNLIELFGGPPTPACGFGMGDVVLGNLLDDRQLIPSGGDMLRALSRPMPLRPAAFIIANESEAAQGQLVPTVARLRRGVESEKHAQGETKPWSTERYAVPPMHARRTYKSTKNIGKLLQDAAASHARFAVIIESAETCTLKDLDTREEIKNVALSSLGAEIARRAPDVVG